MAEPATSYTTGARRLPSLDGIRAVAILLVIVSHAEMAMTTGGIEWIARLGDFGVKMFFVLSGFLITTLLLQEQARTGQIAYGNFVIRRAFRILPAAYAFIFGVVAASRLGWLKLLPGDTLHALTYTTDFVAPSWWLGHLWSLSIEEQYYIIWPLALGLARPKFGGVLMGGVLVGAALCRGVVLIWFPALTEGIERSFMAAVDGFAVGGLLATMQPQLEANERYMRLLRSPWVIVLLLVAMVLDQQEHHPLAFYVVLQSVVYLLLAFLLHRTQVVTTDWIGRTLNFKVMCWLGAISYSLYLWQQPFLAPVEMRLVQNFPACLILSLVFALLSYHLVERPFLRLRDRLVSSHAGPALPVPEVAAANAEGTP